MSRRSHKYRIASGELLTPVLSVALRGKSDVLFDANSTSINSRPFAAPDDAVLIVRACLPGGVSLSLETGRLTPGPMPTGTACEGQICAPYDASMQDVCLHNVCCVAQGITSCSNVVALPPLPGYMRLVLDPPSAVGTVNVFVEAISYKAASLLPDRYWLGSCPIPSDGQ